MIVNECVYSMSIVAFAKRENYLIKVCRNGKNDKHYTVGPRDSLSGTVQRIQSEMEEWRRPQKEK